MTLSHIIEIEHFRGYYNVGGMDMSYAGTFLKAAGHPALS